MNKSILCGIAAMVFWGLSNVLCKALLGHFEPVTLLIVELIASSALLWTLFAVQQKLTLSGSEALRYSLAGLLQPGLAYLFGNFGLSLTTVNSDSLIWATESIVVIFLSWLLLRERIGWTLLFLAICGTMGTIIATTPGAGSGVATSMWLGNILVVAGVLCASLYTIETQRQLVNIEPLYLIALHQACALIVLISAWLVCLPLLHPFNRGTTGTDLILGIICGIIQYAIPFWLYLTALKNLGAARTAILLVLPPIFTILGSFFFLGERLNLWQWFGALIALVAVGGVCVLKTKQIPSEDLLVQKQ